MDLFLTYTPLHLLLTLALLKSEASPALILVGEHFDSARQVAATLPTIIGHEYRVKLIPSSKTLLSRLPRRMADSSAAQKGCEHLVSSYNILRSRRFYRQHDIRRLYIFNDMRPEVKGFAHTALTRGVQDIIYLEDGIGTYLERTDEFPQWERSRKRAFLKYLPSLYGPEWQSTPRLGAFSRLTKAVVFYPDYANSSLREKELVLAPPFALDSAHIDRLITAFDDGQSETLDILAQVRKAIFMLIPHSSIVSENFVAGLRQIAASQPGDVTVLVKYHPREPNRDYLNILSEPNMRSINQTVPAELVCARLDERLAALYTGLSTPLVTTAWISPHPTVYFIRAANTKPAPNELMPLFDRLGVQSLVF